MAKKKQAKRTPNRRWQEQHCGRYKSIKLKDYSQQRMPKRATQTNGMR